MIGKVNGLLPDAPHIFRLGDKVHVTYREQTHEGEVIIASPNGCSLLVMWNEQIYPLMYDHQLQTFLDLITSERVMVTPKSKFAD